jgi:hypothetical protein
MDPNNYDFIIYNEEVIERNLDIIKYKLNLDACFKFMDDTEEFGNTPTSIITLVNERRQTQIAFVIQSSHHNKEHLKKVLYAIEKELKEKFNVENWEPRFMIDDGTVEKAAIKMTGQSFVICKFHLVKAWTKRLATYHKKLAKPKIKEIMKLLYRMYITQKPNRTTKMSTMISFQKLRKNLLHILIVLGTTKNSINIGHA